MIEEESIEIEGETEDEAVSRASQALNTQIENLGYEIIQSTKTSEEPKGLFGLVRGKMRSKKKGICIRAWRRDARDDDTMGEVLKTAKEALSGILSHICDEFTVQAMERSDAIYLTIECDEGGLVIGKNGQNLDAIQYIVRRMVGKQCGDLEKKIIVDTEGYRNRKRESLEAMVKRLAKKVKQTNRREVLRPMNAYERRIVHVFLKNEPGVSTRSEGEGMDRCIVIHPEKGDRSSRRDRSGDDDFSQQGL